MDKHWRVTLLDSKEILVVAETLAVNSKGDLRFTRHRTDNGDLVVVGDVAQIAWKAVCQIDPETGKASWEKQEE